MGPASRRLAECNVAISLLFSSFQGPGYRQRAKACLGSVSHGTWDPASAGLEKSASKGGRHESFLHRHYSLPGSVSHGRRSDPMGQRRCRWRHEGPISSRHEEGCHEQSHRQRRARSGARRPWHPGPGSGAGTHRSDFRNRLRHHRRLTGNCAATTGGPACFPNNRIPPNRIDPNARAGVPSAAAALGWRPGSPARQPRWGGVRAPRSGFYATIHPRRSRCRRRAAHGAG